MNAFTIASSILAIALYIPLCINLLEGKVKQNFATWLLWGILDVIALATLICQDGNYLLLIAYVLGSTAVALSILRSRNFLWTRFETLVVCLVVICIVVWYLTDAKVATIVSTLAILTAGLPQLVDAYRKPWDSPFFTYLGFTVANFLSMLGGKSWTIEERFYPASCVVFCLLIVLFSARKFLRSDEIIA